MLTEQRIRAVLFYLSVFVFLTGLPMILSSAFSYKFDSRALKFTKTGLISLKTQPAGAVVFLNNNLLAESTPATIRELMPGTYSVRLELKDHYPWAADVRVEPNKVAFLDKIILFPLRPNIKHINKVQFDTCFPDEDKGTVYYINYGDSSVYLSDLEGSRIEKAGDLSNLNPPAYAWKLSGDRSKLLYFNRRQIGITYLDASNDRAVRKDPFIMEHPQGAIEDIFWHSDNYHLIVVSSRNVEVLEAKLNSSPVELVKLNKPGTHAFFNSRDDTLYFIDSQKADDGVTYENLYKLGLNAREVPFMELIKSNTDEY
jgi:hypothetical protein